MTKIMAIEGRKVTIYDSYTDASYKTGLSPADILRLVENGRMKDGICFDIPLDVNVKE